MRCFKGAHTGSEIADPFGKQTPGAPIMNDFALNFDLQVY